MEGGERLPLVIDCDGLPDPHIVHYTLSSLRPSGKKASSLETTLYGLLIAKLWAEQRNIDLIDRARSFEFLSSGELLALKDHIRSPNSRSQQSLSLEAVRRKHIGRAAARFRYFVAIQYLEWLGQEYLARLGSTNSSRYLLGKDRLERFVTRATASGKFGGSSENIKPRWGLLKEQRQLFLDIIRPGHPGNPFQSIHQHRNYALLLLYYEFGMRLAEPLTLRLVATRTVQSSVDLIGSYTRERGGAGNSPAIWLVANHDDPDDPRTDQPVLKTAGRLLLFHEESLALKALVEWVNHHRNDETRYQGGKRSPFLFISRQSFLNNKGKRIASPISKKQVAKLFQAIKAHHPSLKDITAHVLRHDWNDRWNEMLRERGERWEDHTRDQCYAMGWDPQSKMPHRYGRRSIQQQANTKSMALQRRALQGK